MADQHELRDKGLRLTPQRELVLSAVRSLGHATPEEVADKVKLEAICQSHKLFPQFVLPKI